MEEIEVEADGTLPREILRERCRTVADTSCDQGTAATCLDTALLAIVESRRRKTSSVNQRIRLLCSNIGHPDRV